MYRHRKAVSRPTNPTSSCIDNHNQFHIEEEEEGVEEATNSFRSSSRWKSRFGQQNDSEQEEYLLNPTISISRSTSTSTDARGRRDSSEGNGRRIQEQDAEELDPFARPLKRSKLDGSRSHSTNASRTKVLLSSLTLFSLMAISIFTLKYRKSTPVDQFKQTEPPQKSLLRKPSIEEKILQELSLTLPSGIHLFPQHQNQEEPSTAVKPPVRFHRDPLPTEKFRYPKRSQRRKVDGIELFQPFTERENCIEDWIAKGEICHQLDLHSRDTNRLESASKGDEYSGTIGVWRDRKIDVVWTWVNGSDSRHSVSRRMYREKPSGRWADDELDYEFLEEKHLVERIHLEKEALEKEKQQEAGDGINKVAKRANNPVLIPPRPTKFTPDDSDQRFRETGELKFSMRSSLKHLGNSLGKMHVISPDYPAPRHLQTPNHGRSSDQRSPSDSRMDNSSEDLADVGETSPRRIADSAGGRLQVRAPLRDSEELPFAFPSELSSNETSDHFRSKEDGKLRFGQVPTWLDVSNKALVSVGQDSLSESSLEAKVKFHHDWNVFNHNFLLPPNREISPEETKKILRWKREVLPTFNSMAIESMIGDLPSLSEDFISSNDDFFFGQDLALSEFNSPLYGLVFHFQPDLLVGSRKPGSIEASAGGSGEWPALYDSNYLLNQRFGQKDRAYVSHVHRSFSKALLLEMRMIWAKEIFRASFARWRGQVSRDLVNHFLFSHFVIERHREALLWSLLVGKIDGNSDGRLDEIEYDAFLKSIGLNEKSLKYWKDSLLNPHDHPIPILKIPIRLPQRDTILDQEISSNLEKIGYPKFKQTQLKFSSHDGYPFMRLNPLVQLSPPVQSAGKGVTRIKAGADFEPYPNFIPNEKTKYRFGEDLEIQDPLDRPNPNGVKAVLSQMKEENKVKESRPESKSNRHKAAEDMKRAACVVDLEECFTRHFKRDGNVETAQVFQRFAFEKRECGDCLILQGIRKSGAKGFDFFLPTNDQLFPNANQVGVGSDGRVRLPPHLPLTKSSGSSAVSEETDDDLEKIELPDFSLASISEELGWQGGGIRDFSRRLILRYTYAIGELPTKFISLQSPIQAATSLKELQESTPALFCLNDDMGDRAERGFMDFLLNKFLGQELFPEPMPFESSRT